jgi:hypothetical protein
MKKKGFDFVLELSNVVPEGSNVALKLASSLTCAPNQPFLAFKAKSEHYRLLRVQT